MQASPPTAAIKPVTAAEPQVAVKSVADWHARMQFYNGEDPATGSAAGCAIAYLVQHGRAANGQTVVLEQGIEIGRPSRITVQARLKGAAADEDSLTHLTHLRQVPGMVFVGGRTIPVATGRFFLP